MITTSPTTLAQPDVPIPAVRHWHITESDAGYLPEAEPVTVDDGEMALDVLAHLLADWAQSFDDAEHPDAVYAEGLAEQLCTCKKGERSAEHRDAQIKVADGRGMCEHIGDRVFDLTPCQDQGCLKYCPDADCGTVTPIGDTDPSCWCCGTRYVDGETCGWLA
ncbi:hypothetical protein [Actinomadura sp. 3N407]|uniref:hypothetical protein n=1 Tax=Actinomadura sp. 3N407 TaxID=3457423 RepID=UPI003FCC9162